MNWDLGVVGVAVLLLLALGFGIVAQLTAGRAAPRVGLVAATVYFVSGLIISEGFFGWATEEDLQPNIDGLSFDEVLLIGLLPGFLSILVSVIAAKPTRRRHHGPHAA